MPESSEQLTVERDDEQSRYEIFSGETLAGYSLFEAGSGGRLAFTHTVIDPAFRGKGIGEALASEALADAARRGETIVPLCPFIAQYLKTHDVAGAIVDWPYPPDAQDAATPGEPPE